MNCIIITAIYIYRPIQAQLCGVHTTVPSVGRYGVVSGVHRCVRRFSAVCLGYVRRMSAGLCSKADAGMAIKARDVMTYIVMA